MFREPIGNMVWTILMLRYLLSFGMGNLCGLSTETYAKPFLDQKIIIMYIWDINFYKDYSILFSTISRVSFKCTYSLNRDPFKKAGSIFIFIYFFQIYNQQDGPFR